MIHWTAGCVPYVRTPAERFAHLVDFPYTAHYAVVDGLHMAYEDVGPRNGQVVVMLHGEPSWSYLYRKMIPILASAGYRVITPDMIGMGRSDKPVEFKDYTYLNHVHWVEEFIQDLHLHDITAFVQDWGSLIGLRVVGDHPDWFARVVIANGNLPVLPQGFKFVTVPNPPLPNASLVSPIHKGGTTDAFQAWATFALVGTSLQASQVVNQLTAKQLSPRELAAYDAPFPSRIYMTGVRVFPSLIDTVSDPPTNAAAAQVFRSWTKPLATFWGLLDPSFGSKGSVRNAWLAPAVPGAAGQPSHLYPDASHFIQEDEGRDLAQRVAAFIKANPLRG